MGGLAKEQEVMMKDRPLTLYDYILIGGMLMSYIMVFTIIIICAVKGINGVILSSGIGFSGLVCGIITRKFCEKYDRK